MPVSWAACLPVSMPDDYDCSIDRQADLKEANILIANFNPEQTFVYERIMDAADDKSAQKCILLACAGGCGKTYVYRSFI